MEEINHLSKSGTIADTTTRTSLTGGADAPVKSINCVEIEKLKTKGGKNFFKYLRQIDLIKDPGILVLTSENHYFYDHKELKNTTTLIFLKKLNLIGDLEGFLSVLKNVLSPGANFIGYFSDSDLRNGSGLLSVVQKGLINRIESGSEKQFNREEVARLLAINGFNVLDMTIIRGLTYFRAINSTGNN